VWLCFFQWHFIDLFSCIAASQFNTLTYLITMRHAIIFLWQLCTVYCIFVASLLGYIGTACMFTKMLSAVLFARQNPVYAVVYVLACFCEYCASLFCQHCEKIDFSHFFIFVTLGLSFLLHIFNHYVMYQWMCIKVRCYVWLTATWKCRIIYVLMYLKHIPELI